MDIPLIHFATNTDHAKAPESRRIFLLKFNQ